jgi:hypothetical protein
MRHVIDLEGRRILDAVCHVPGAGIRPVVLLSVKEHQGYIYDLQREKLELELKTLKAGGVRSASGEYEKKITAYKEKVERYEKEKEEIKQKAEDLEKKRDAAQRHSAAFGMATMFLQIAILLSSIAALMKQKYFWFLGIAGGCIGLLYFFNGFFLFMN